MKMNKINKLLTCLTVIICGGVILDYFFKPPTPIVAIEKSISQKVLEPVLMIKSVFADTGSSSAVVIGQLGENYFAVTANHCIREENNEGSNVSSIELYHVDFTGQMPAPKLLASGINIVLRDEEKDILIFNFTAFEPVPIAQIITQEEFDKLQIGDEVLAVGCPVGLFQTITHGHLSWLRLNEALLLGGRKWHIEPPDRANHIMRITASIIYGNSGGGIFTKNGLLLGVTQMVGMHQYTPITHIHYGTSILHVKDILQSRNLETILVK